MNQILNKLERRFGRYAVPDLIKYVVALYCAGAVIGLLNRDIYYQYLSLNMEAVFHGQIWRLFTFLIEPYGFSRGMGMLISIIFFLFRVNLFFLFGRSLEQAWGTFRFNMYFFSGYLLNIIAALILYLSPMHATLYDSGFQYIYWSMFFAFALLNPNMEFLLYMVLPIKVKWLAILDAAFMLYQIFGNIRYGILLMRLGQYFDAEMCFSAAVAIVVAMANFLIYFFATPAGGRYEGGARHRCAVCGRTELDNENLDFRFCSKCEGNYEYCSDHLFTHQHVKK